MTASANESRPGRRSSVLGVDVGRVLISAAVAGSTADTSFLTGSFERAMETPPSAGLFEALPALVDHCHGQVWLVSKAQPRTQERTRAWLHRHHFFERTGIDPGHLRFCLKRWEKADHARELGMTHFIDDRLDVLDYLRGIVPHRYLFGPQDPDVRVPPGITRLPSWPEARLSRFRLT